MSKTGETDEPTAGAAGLASQESLVASYLRTQTDATRLHPAALAYYGSLDVIGATAPSVARAIVRELRDQRSNLKLIASENYCSLATQLAQGNLFTDKYAEGYPGHRFYAGCDNVDAVEAEAAAVACELFGAQHAYVQPHSGADANLVAFLAILATVVERPELEAIGQTNPLEVPREQWQRLRERLRDQRILSLDMFAGGHLTHGYRHNVSSRLFDVHTYGTDRQSGLIDLDAVRAELREVRPLILLAGYSAYPRRIDFAKMREMADEVGAVLMVDMAHFAGLVAGKVFTGDHDPVPHAHVVTSTTHKTLRGPRGGLVLCEDRFADAVDKGCPAVLGGPLPHVLAAKLVALREATRPEFRRYAGRIVENARTLAAELIRRGVTVLTGGTDNHMVLVDVRTTYGLTGRQAETALRSCGLTLNRNAIPFDEFGPWYTSGLRIGTAAVTTLGMGTDEMVEIAGIVDRVLRNSRPVTIAEGARRGEASRVKFDLDPAIVAEARGRAGELLGRHPLYPEIDLDLLSRSAYGRD